MDEHLSDLYDKLKNGSSYGINLYQQYQDFDHAVLKNLYNRAINEGFADRPSISYADQLPLILTKDGKTYSTYIEYKNRNLPMTTQITNSILGNNNSKNNVGQDLEVLPHSQPTNNPNQNTIASKINDVNISKGQFIFWLFTAFTTGFGFAYMIFNIVKK